MKELEDNFRNIIEYFKNNNCTFDEEEIQNTPIRLSKMFSNELLIGYKQSPEEILSKTFKSQKDDLVIVKNISFVSLCSHHWLPFIGYCHFGYLPNKKVVGLSKIPRLIECFSKRFQIQEKMTREIVDSFQEIIQPQGCIAIIKAKHLCAQIRGVENHTTEMVTSAIRGCFKNSDIRNEFLKLTET